MFACRASSIIINGGGEKAVCEFHCASWDCDHCAEDKRAALIAKLIGGNPDVAWTVTTVVGSYGDPVKARNAMVAAWQDFIDSEVQRRKLKRPPYGIVIEAGEGAWPHMHILMRHWYIDFHRLQEWMQRRLKAHRVHFDLLRDPKAGAKYMGKYLGKAPHRFGTGKRYWFTQNWDQRPPHQPWREKRPGERHWIFPLLWHVIRDRHLENAWTLIREGKTWAILGEPP
jgi:hypothetical protein